MRNKFYPACIFLCLLLSTVNSFSQSGTYGNNILTEKPNTPIDSVVNGYIEILPADYASNPTKKYPLLIFIEGNGQFGDGSSTDLQSLYGQNNGMFPDIVRKGRFPNRDTVGGTIYEFIVIVPQIRQQVQNGRPSSQQNASPTEVNDIVNYALQYYRVDAQRVYLSGLSLGGGSVINYAGQSSSYGNRAAAIVPFSPASNLWDNHSRVTNIAAANVPLWIFEITGDQPYDTLGQRYIDSLNTHRPSYSAEALITMYPSGGHDSWQPALDSPSNTGNATYPNVYNWMLTKSRSLVTQPQFATMSAGSDQTLNLSNGSMVLSANGISFTGATVTLTGSASPPSGRTIVGRQWASVNGNGGTITSPNSLTTTVTGLKPGFYTYQLRVTDDQGLVSVADVNITVNAPPENKYLKLEAEAFSSVNPGAYYLAPSIDKSAIDNGPATVLGNFDSSRWAEYTSIPIPGAGTYALYYRYTSPWGNPMVKIIVNGTTTTTRTLVSDGTWRSDSIHLNLGTSPTIRFQSQTTNAPINLNYFEFAQISSTLPVKFIFFNTQCKNGAVNLFWKTAQEQNSRNFSVQKSSDGTHWNEIATLPAAGQSNGERSYQFSDNSQISSNNLYRVVEYDFDGKATISTIVKSNCSSKYALSLYPNPTSGNTDLTINLEQATKITVSIIDGIGALLHQQQILLPAGNTTIPLNLSSYAKGVYNINVNYNSDFKTIKIVKQ